MAFEINYDAVTLAAAQVLGRSPTDRQFRSLFGTSLFVAAIVLERIPGYVNPLHLLWALYFLKGYGTAVNCAAFFQVDERTFRFHSWATIEKMSMMVVFQLQDRFRYAAQNVALMSIDGTDCRIQEPRPFNKRWFSHKFHSAGLRYEVGLAIDGGIVWISGPFPCGEWPDLAIARAGILQMLEFGEKVIADAGYRGDNRVISPSGLNNFSARLHSLIRARHETLNARLKIFNVLSHVFRHNIMKHSMCFHAVANIVQLEIEAGFELFSVHYDEYHGWD